MKKLDISKQIEDAIRWDFMNEVLAEEYKTIGGNLAIVITKKGGGECPWIGFYYASDQTRGEWIPCAWTERGKILSMSKSGKTFYPLDLDTLEEQPQLA